MPTIRQSVAAGSQFTGLTSTTGLMALTGLPSASHEYVLHRFRITTPDAGTITTGKLDAVDLSEGFLAYDGQTGNLGTDTTVNGDGDGDADADIVSDDDDGATGTLHLKNIVGTFENDDDLTGDDTFVAVANGAVEFKRQVIDDFDSVDLADGACSIEWGDSDEGYGVPKNRDPDSSANGTSYAIRFVSTGLTLATVIELDYGYRYVRE